jgi:hypothetical protein
MIGKEPGGRAHRKGGRGGGGGSGFVEESVEAAVFGGKLGLEGIGVERGSHARSNGRENGAEGKKWRRWCSVAFIGGTTTWGKGAAWRAPHGGKEWGGEREVRPRPVGGTVIRMGAMWH